MKKLMSLITVMILSLCGFSQIAGVDSVTVSTTTGKKVLYTSKGTRVIDANNSKKDQEFATGKASNALSGAKTYADTRYNEGWKAGIKSADSLFTIKFDAYKKQMDTTISALKKYADDAGKASAVAEVSKLPLIQDGVGTKVTQVNPLLIQIDLKQ